MCAFMKDLTIKMQIFFSHFTVTHYTGQQTICYNELQ